jgi:hypothetical protein
MKISIKQLRNLICEIRADGGGDGNGRLRLKDLAKGDLLVVKGNTETYVPDLGWDDPRTGAGDGSDEVGVALKGDVVKFLRVEKSLPGEPASGYLVVLHNGAVVSIPTRELKNS